MMHYTVHTCMASHPIKKHKFINIIKLGGFGLASRPRENELRKLWRVTVMSKISLITVWILRWFQSVAWRAKPLSQIWQTYGRSPVCVRSWFFRWGWNEFLNLCKFIVNCNNLSYRLTEGHSTEIAFVWLLSRVYRKSCKRLFLKGQKLCLTHPLWIRMWFFK